MHGFFFLAEEAAPILTFPWCWNEKDLPHVFSNVVVTNGVLGIKPQVYTPTWRFCRIWNMVINLEFCTLVVVSIYGCYIPMIEVQYGVDVMDFFGVISSFNLTRIFSM